MVAMHDDKRGCLRRKEKGGTSKEKASDVRRGDHGGNLSTMKGV